MGQKVKKQLNRPQIQSNSVGLGEQRPAHTRSPWGQGLSSAEWLGACFALLFVHAALFRKIIYSASIGDAIEYQTLARRIADSGLFSAAAYAPARTYGYPLFLSPLASLEKLTSIPPQSTRG